MAMEIMRRDALKAAYEPRLTVSEYQACKLVIQIKGLVEELQCQPILSNQRFDTLGEFAKCQSNLAKVSHHFDSVEDEINSDLIDMIGLEQSMSAIYGLINQYDTSQLYFHGQKKNKSFFNEIGAILNLLENWLCDNAGSLAFVKKAEVNKLLYDKDVLVLEDDEAEEEEHRVPRRSRLNVQDPDYVKKCEQLIQECVDQLNNANSFLVEYEIEQRLRDTIDKMGIPLKFYNIVKIYLQFRKDRLKYCNWTSYVQNHKYYCDGHGVPINSHTTNYYHIINQVAEHVLLGAISNCINECVKFSISIDTNSFQNGCTLTMSF